MCNLISIFVIFIFESYFGFGYDMKGFDDTVLYRIDWPGNVDMKFDEEKFEPMVVTTPDQEKYKCMIPQTSSKDEENRSVNINLSPLNLLNPLFSSSSCSYRIEAYWTYEVCHGSHVKQFHEDREGKNIKVQEYNLGKWDSKKMEMLEQKLKEDQEKGRKFKTTKIDNVRYPYLEMEMSDGTLCDLNNNEPRVTKVRYVCYPHGKVDIYSLKETSTCNYEAIILTPALCMHPEFLPEDSNENVINCIPMNDSPEKPLSWLLNEVDSLKQRYKQFSDVMRKEENTIFIKIDPKDGTLRMEFLQGDLFDKATSLDIPDSDEETSSVTDGITVSPSSSASSSDTTQSDLPKLSTSVKDTTPVNEFLEGKNCLTGGTGWWKYEFCYGRYVRQFHVDKNGENSIILGFFDEKLHKEWLKLNPAKRPKPISIRTETSHHYEGGSLCDRTGEKRQVEVKLKCLANVVSPSTVSMYLLEPKICQYILVVESPLICDILKLADDDGLVPKEQPKESSRDGKPVESVYIGNIPVEDLEVRYEND